MIVKLIDDSGHNADADGDATKNDAQQQGHINSPIVTWIAWIPDFEMMIMRFVAVGTNWTGVTDSTGAMVRGANVVQHLLRAPVCNRALINVASAEESPSIYS